MTRIVYAALHYTPPPGIIVLPLESHPAIVEDAQRAVVEKRKYTIRNPKIPKQMLAVVEWLKLHGEGTAPEIAAALGMNRNRARGILDDNPDLFCQVGERLVRMPLIEIVIAPWWCGGWWRGSKTTHG